MIDYDRLSREQLIRCLKRLEKTRTDGSGGADTTRLRKKGAARGYPASADKSLERRDEFTACLERIAAAATHSFDPDDMLHNILGVVRELFAADRAWLLYPCDPDAPSVEVKIEATSQEYPGAVARNEPVRISSLERRFARRLLDAAGPVTDLSLRDGMASAEQFGFQSQMAMVVRPNTGQPWLLGLHQCSYERMWNDQEQALFGIIAERMSSALNVTNLRAALQDSERRLALALAGADDAIWDWDLAAGTCYVSPEFAAKLATDAECPPQSSTPCPIGIHPDDEREFRAALSRHLDKQTPQFAVEFRIRPKKRRWRWILARGKVVDWSDDGEARRVVGTYTDITKRKEIERDLERSRARLQKAQEIAQLGSWEFSIATNTAVWSHELREILGIDRSVKPHPETLLGLIHPEDRDRFRRAMADAKAHGGPYDVQYRIIRPDGDVRHLHSKAEVFRDSLRRPAAMVGIVQDVTRYKNQEERLAQLLLDNRRLTQECMRAQEAERRQLAHDLHDELGQSLTAIQMSASYLNDRLAALEPGMQKAAADIMKAASRALDVVRATARRLRPAVLDYLGLEDTFRESLATWSAYARNIESRLDVAGDIEDLSEDIRIVLYRILQECLTNTAKHAEATSVGVRLAMTDEGVTLTVEDNGKGIAVDEPSSGLGLLSIKERVLALDGDFEIDSKPDEGTRLSVRLPVNTRR